MNKNLIKFRDWLADIFMNFYKSEVILYPEKKKCRSIFIDRNQFM